LPSAR